MIWSSWKSVEYFNLLQLATSSSQEEQWLKYISSLARVVDSAGLKRGKPLLHVLPAFCWQWMNTENRLRISTNSASSNHFITSEFAFRYLNSTRSGNPWLDWIQVATKRRSISLTCLPKENNRGPRKANCLTSLVSQRNWWTTNLESYGFYKMTFCRVQ